MISLFFSIILGIIAALPVVFPDVGFLLWVILIPFGMICFSDKEKKAKREYLDGFLFFFGFYLVCYSWFLSMYPLSITGLHPVVVFGVVLLAFLGIPAFQSVGFAFVYFVLRRAKQRGLCVYILPFLGGALWCIGEWTQNFFWFGLPWVKLALGLTEIAELYRSSNLFGSYFVTFLIVSVNLLLALSFKEKSKSKRCFSAFAAFAIFILNAVYGVVDLNVSMKKDPETIKISAFQGNISTEEKWSDYMLEHSVEIYKKFAEEAAEQGADYALLPETVIPYVTEDFHDIDETLGDIAWKNNITLMVGTFGKVGGGTGNVIRVYEPMKKGVNVYAKQKPVPFGEYVPMRKIVLSILPVLGEINILDRSLVAGEKSSVWRGDDATFGYLICFDSIYDHIAKSSVRNGAELLMISTNDSWFGDSVGTKMHSAQAKLRAVENGRSVVRAANTGITSIISPFGQTLAFIPTCKEGQITVNVPVVSSFTLYTVVGNLFVYMCIIFSAFCVLPYPGRLIFRLRRVRTSSQSGGGKI